MSGLSEQAALAVSLHDIVEVGLGDVLRAKRISREEHRLGVFSRLGTDVNRHVRRTLARWARIA